MLCSDPYYAKVPKSREWLVDKWQRDQSYPHACGKCPECKANKARVWKHRILLEADMYSVSSFVTLTYDDAFLPEDRSVSKEELQKYLKRLRGLLDVKKEKLRYFAVGEYGDKNFRPHYHLCLFGVGDYVKIRKAWRVDGRKNGVLKGFVYIGMVEPKSAGYMTGYVTKNLTKEEDPVLVEKGLRPEFMMASKMPEDKEDKYGGLGVKRIRQIGKRLKNKPGVKTLVVRELSRGKIQLPLGDYLTKKLIEYADLNLTAYEADYWANQEVFFDKQLEEDNYAVSVYEEDLGKREGRKAYRSTMPGRRRL